jgi:hypothetical protein
MTFTVAKERPEGLAAGEAAVVLAGGETAAVSVSSRWLENGGGVAFVAGARWIDPDGVTRLCPNGQQIRVEATHSADPHSVREFGVDAISRELLLAVLGEDPTLIERMGEGGAFEAPMLMHGEEWRMNASIRHAIDTASATAPRHAAALLFGASSEAIAPKATRKTSK